MVRVDDEKELAKRFDTVHVDTKSASAMFEVLRKKLNHTAAFPHFMSLLQHCILLPRELIHRDTPSGRGLVSKIMCFVTSLIQGLIIYF